MVRDRRGYSLVEMMMVVAIIGVIAMAAPTLMVQINRFFILNKTRLEIQREARSAIDIVSRNLRQAQANTIVIDQLTGQPYYSRIRFTRLQGSGTSDVTCYQDGTKLIISINSRTQTLTENLRYVAFTFPQSSEMGIVSVSMTMEKRIYEGKMKALHVASEKVRVMNE